MPNKPINLLSTRPLDVDLLKKAASFNVFIDCIPFIETTSCINEEKKTWIKTLANKKTTIAFTSMNAVEGIIENLDGLHPDWNIFCMGGTTKTIIKKYFGEEAIKGIGTDSKSLAECIIKQDAKEVVFFCGNIRRDEMPQLLTKQHIKLYEMVVYNTINTPVQITKVYDGILFFSPSAVDSFFSINKIGDSNILFAIGSTTSKAIKNYSLNTIIKADSPEKDNLVKKAISYFTKKSNHANHPLEGLEGQLLTH